MGALSETLFRQKNQPYAVQTVFRLRWRVLSGGAGPGIMPRRGLNKIAPESYVSGRDFGLAVNTCSVLALQSAVLAQCNGRSCTYHGTLWSERMLTKTEWGGTTSIRRAVSLDCMALSDARGGGLELRAKFFMT